MLGAELFSENQLRKMASCRVCKFNLVSSLYPRFIFVFLYFWVAFLILGRLGSQYA